MVRVLVQLYAILNLLESVSVMLMYAGVPVIREEENEDGTD